MLQKDSMRHAGFPGFPRRFPAVSLQVSQGFFLRANLVSFFPCAKNIAFRGLTASKKCFHVLRRKKYQNLSSIKT